jgi:hypothetical protein
LITLGGVNEVVLIVLNTYYLFDYLIIMESVKMKNVVLSKEQKPEALKNLDTGETMQKLTSKHEVGHVIVGDWKRKRNEIEK